MMQRFLDFKLMENIMQSNVRNRTSEISETAQVCLCLQQTNQYSCTSDRLMSNNKYGGHWRQGCEELIDD